MKLRVFCCRCKKAFVEVTPTPNPDVMAANLDDDGWHAIVRLGSKPESTTIIPMCSPCWQAFNQANPTAHVGPTPR